MKLGKGVNELWSAVARECMILFELFILLRNRFLAFFYHHKLLARMLCVGPSYCCLIEFAAVLSITPGSSRSDSNLSKHKDDISHKEVGIVRDYFAYNYFSFLQNSQES